MRAIIEVVGIFLKGLFDTINNEIRWQLKTKIFERNLTEKAEVRKQKNRKKAERQKRKANRQEKKTNKKK